MIQFSLYKVRNLIRPTCSPVLKIILLLGYSGAKASTITSCKPTSATGGLLGGSSLSKSAPAILLVHTWETPCCAFQPDMESSTGVDCTQDVAAMPHNIFMTCSPGGTLTAGAKELRIGICPSGACWIMTHGLMFEWHLKEVNYFCRHWYLVYGHFKSSLI